MRIRKRQVPLPLSSLSPIPLSDLQVQLQPCTPPPPDKTRTSLTGGPNHQTKPPIGNQFTNETAAQDRAKLVADGDGVGSEEEQLGGDSSGSAMGESIIIESGLSSSSHQVGGSYYDGERSFPLKERSLIFEMEEKDKKKKKMRSLKAKVNKKCNDEEDEDYRETMMEGNAKRKGNRGNVLMEGSRCSRVNGRGWRCCQPTLVGYSLCEHHLGKGRLRSVMTVKTRVAKSNKRLLPSNSSKTAKLERIDEADDDDDGSDEHKVALIMSGGAKKMMKIGLVKARSMSSLLSQVDPKNGGAGSGVNAEEASDGKESSG